MSEFEEVTTGLGEECGVFGAYDMDAAMSLLQFIMDCLHCSIVDRKAAESQ